MNHFKINTIKGSLNLITGCGSGLGKATLQWFLKNGSGPILGIDRDFEKDFENSLDLNDDQKSNLLLKTHDTFDEEQTEKSLSEFTNKFGPIDNVINSAGVALAFPLYWKTGAVFSNDHAESLLKFNTVGTFNIIRLASRFMIESSTSRSNISLSGSLNRTRCIINTSCISTTAPSLGQSFYAATNSALDSMTLCIARELSHYKIRCNTINVGYFDTKLLRSSESRVAEHIGNISLTPKRIGHPDEFAHLVQAIVENQMLNGCCIKIDAGAREVI